MVNAVTNRVSFICPLQSGSKARASIDAELVFTKGSVPFFLALAFLGFCSPQHAAFMLLEMANVHRWASSKLTHCPQLCVPFSRSLPPQRECQSCRFHQCSLLAILKCIRVPACKRAKCFQSPHMAPGTTQDRT